MITTDMSIRSFIKTIEEALEGCSHGRVNDALKSLYRAPYRECVPWCQFPNWARPNDPVEGCHEG